jgi:hypothetical protein
MLEGFQRLGYFPKAEDVPEAVVAHIRSGLRFTSDALAVSLQRSRQR